MKRIEIYLRNLLTRILLFVNPVKKVEGNIKVTSNSNILFIRLNRIGDALVTTPLLKIVKEKVGCRITVLADKKNHFIFRNNPNIDEVIIFNKSLSNFLKFKNLTETRNFDAVFDLHDDVSTTVSYLIALAKCEYKVGLEKENSKLFTHTIKRMNPQTTHIVDRILKISSIIGIDSFGAETNIQYFPSEDSEKFVENKLLSYFSSVKPIIGINISAGSNARFWGIERYKKLLKEIDAGKNNIIIISAEKDLKNAEEISENNYQIFCSPDFNEFASMVSKLNFLFTPDTSIIHLASAYKIPTFGIYVKYKTSDLIWSPYKSKFDCVVTEEPNFENLSYEMVAKRFIPFFKKIIN